ncbi:hypothetical protein [Nocardioides montaniterrae]
MSNEKWDVYDAPDDAPRPETRAAAGEPLPSAVRERGGRRTPWVVGALVALVLLVVAVVVAFRSGGSTENGQPEDTTPIAFAPVMTAGDRDRFVAALRQRAGTTTIEELTAFEDSFSVVVPAGNGRQLPREYFWRRDSGLRDSGDAVDEGHRETFDLATLDLSAVEKFFAAAWHSVDESVTGYSLSVVPPPSPGKSWLGLFLHVPGHAFYAFDGDLDGTIVNRRRVEDE